MDPICAACKAEVHAGPSRGLRAAPLPPASSEGSADRLSSTVTSGPKVDEREKRIRWRRSTSRRASTATRTASSRRRGRTSPSSTTRSTATARVAGGRIGAAPAMARRRSTSTTCRRAPARPTRPSETCSQAEPSLCIARSSRPATSGSQPTTSAPSTRPRWASSAYRPTAPMARSCPVTSSTRPAGRSPFRELKATSVGLRNQVNGDVHAPGGRGALTRVLTRRSC
jgi:hypothetical protein